MNPNILPLEITDTGMTYSKETQAYLAGGQTLLRITPKRDELVTGFFNYTGEGQTLAQVVGPSHDEWKPLINIAGRIATGKSPIEGLNLKHMFEIYGGALYDKGSHRASWQLLMERQLQFSKTLWCHRDFFLILNDFDTLPWSNELAENCPSHDFMDWHTPSWPTKNMRTMIFFSQPFTQSGHGKLEHQSRLIAGLELMAQCIQTPVVFNPPLWAGRFFKS